MSVVHPINFGGLVVNSPTREPKTPAVGKNWNTIDWIPHVSQHLKNKFYNSKWFKQTIPATFSFESNLLKFLVQWQQSLLVRGLVTDALEVVLVGNQGYENLNSLLDKKSEVKWAEHLKSLVSFWWLEYMKVVTGIKLGQLLAFRGRRGGARHTRD